MSYIRTFAGLFAIGLMLLGAGLLTHLDASAAREDKLREDPLRAEVTQRLRLSEEEWERYWTWRDLVGSPFAKLTPYEVLGMYADDPEEKRRYARENARFMLDFYRRSQAFEALYRQAMEELAQAE